MRGEPEGLGVLRRGVSQVTLVRSTAPGSAARAPTGKVDEGAVSTGSPGSVA